MCDSFGNQCFYMTMNKNNDAIQQCSHCDYDCNQTQYSTSFVTRNIDPEKFCRDELSRDDYPILTIKSYMNIIPYYSNHNPQYFYLNWKAHVDGKKFEFNMTEHCLWKVQNDFAIVNVYLSTPTIPRMKQDVKYKPQDKLALLGSKTL